MTKQQLVEQIFLKKSYLCIGLDTDFDKIPVHLQSHPDAIFEFNKQIIDATKDVCVSYKINTAFYEALGAKGWEIMERTVNYISKEHFIIADAKRGDIGNTSSQYAKAFFETLNFDAITVAPYMGEDSILPFLNYENKCAIVLALTSNKGANDFELLQLVSEDGIKLVGGDTRQGRTTPVDDAITNQSKTAPVGVPTNRNKMLYEKVLQTVSAWGSPDNLMFVVGATQAAELQNIRNIIPDHFLLVPGVGFQGGSLQEVSKYGMNKECGLLINVSRAIIYASEREDFAAEARAIALQYQTEMRNYLLSI
jgi:orotidine-5'-phosphate decarboxylase